MIEFILNQRQVSTDAHPGTPLLEVIRREFRLTGTKLACGEGECGACTILAGRQVNGRMQYRSLTSCVTPLVNIRHQHVLTIEGISGDTLTPVQQAMVDCNGTQCGFCTPGFVMSLTGTLLNDPCCSKESLVAAMDGNICRCTGYKSIERAASQLVAQLDNGDTEVTPSSPNGLAPGWLNEIPARLNTLKSGDPNGLPNGTVHVGGGTDLYVQRPYRMHRTDIVPMAENELLKGIRIANGRCNIGASVTMTELQQSPELNHILPGIHDYLSPIGSTQIRNMATVAGNLVNASPIGDTTIMLLALDSTLTLSDGANHREIKLKEFYLGYKQLAKEDREFVHSIHFDLPDPTSRFHFERVCKRTYLDVASVNSACLLQLDGEETIATVHLAIGGVAPVPLYLRETCEFLRGKPVEKETIAKALRVLQEEIAPISDIRGSAEYKRLLARQQFFLHLSQTAPGRIEMKSLLDS